MEMVAESAVKPVAAPAAGKVANTAVEKVAAPAAEKVANSR